jgi:hypothetical protein
VHVELLEEVLDVGADGMLADEQVPPDAGVVPALAEQAEHLTLARERRDSGESGARSLEFMRRASSSSMLGDSAPSPSSTAPATRSIVLAP